MGILEILVVFGLIYIALSYTVDLFFLFIGLLAISRQRRIRKTTVADDQYPSLNVLIPCFNEEKVILSTIRYLREINYPNLKFTLINDGSTDNTLSSINQELDLIPYLTEYTPVIPTQEVNDIFVSSDNQFIVIDKVNGGKADTLNTGLNITKSDLVCCVDADTIIKGNSLKQMVKTFITDNRVVAVGGCVRIKNDSETLPGFPKQLRSPKTVMARLQVLEYIRSINIARNALALINGNLIISGAFGIFKTAVVKDVGGYEKFSKGEDFELVTRLHFHLLKSKKPYRIKQFYFADSFTDGPVKYKELSSQRRRWQLGLVSTLKAHFFKFLKFPFRAITFFSLPYFIIFEILSPFFQVISYFLIPLFVILKLVTVKYLFILLLTFLYSFLINFLYLLTDFYYRPYYAFSDKVKLIATSMVESLFYHQLNCFWKIRGTIGFVKNIFIKAAWVPPRNLEDFKSRLLDVNQALPALNQEKSMDFSVDYKSLYKQKIVIISLKGSFQKPDINDFEDVVYYFKKKSRIKVILDLEELNHISSESLSSILNISRHLRKAKGGGVVILNPQNKIFDELKISNAVKEVKVVNNFSDAIKELQYG